MYDTGEPLALMDALFWWCVEAIVAFAKLIGVSYEAANIILFVGSHPLLTLALLVWLVAALRQNRRLRRRRAATQGAEARAGGPGAAQSAS